MKKDKGKAAYPGELSNPVRVTDVLDLHGFYPEQIAEIVSEYIEWAAKEGMKKVRITHGKGKSRLKWETRQTLAELPWCVAAYDAPPELGGWGSTIVELKQEQNKKK